MATFGSQSLPSITVQGLISANADLDPNVVINRTNMAASASADSTVIGATALDELRLQIEEGELLFSTTLGYHTGPRSASGRRPVVFSSFNGYPVEKGIQQEMFEDEFMFFGLAQNNTFPEGTGMNNGIAVKRAGSGTTLNNGTDTFCPGDTIGFRLPSVDDAKRAREVSSVERRIGTDRYRPNKHVAILKKITYEEITSQFDLAVAVLLDSIEGASVVEFDRMSSSGEQPVYGSLRELAVLIKKSFNWTFMSAIQAAVQMGIVTWGAGVSGAADSEKFESLGKKLGLVAAPPREEDTALQRNFFLLALNSSLGRAHRAAQETAERELDFYLSPSSAPTLPAFGQSGGRRNKTPEQLKSVARTASNGLARSFGRCMNNYERSTFATASCYAAPGNNVDIVMRA